MAKRKHLEIFQRIQNQVCSSADRAGLKGADLSDSQLVAALLVGVDLSGSNLSGANLNVAELNESNLSNACLTRCSLHNAILKEADLSGANLTEASLVGDELSNSNLEGANLRNACLHRATIFNATLNHTILSGASLLWANLSSSSLVEANLRGADLRQANLSYSRLTNADLRGANLTQANLSYSDLSEANLSGADLSGAALVSTKLNSAKLSGARVYGVSTWDVEVDQSTSQQDLVITSEGTPEVRVDDIEVAQFVYFLLRNDKLRNIIDTVGRRGVLLLGRFTEGRTQVLERLREALRQRGYVPIVFNFDRPETKDFTETVRLLASMSKFVIADITNPRSAPLELQATVPEIMVPFQPIIADGEQPFAMLQDLWIKHRDWVFRPIQYSSIDRLVETMDAEIITPAEARFNELVLRRAQAMPIRRV